MINSGLPTMDNEDDDFDEDADGVAAVFLEKAFTVT